MGELREQREVGEDFTRYVGLCKINAIDAAGAGAGDAGPMTRGRVGRIPPSICASVDGVVGFEVVFQSEQHLPVGRTGDCSTCSVKPLCEMNASFWEDLRQYSRKKLRKMDGIRL